MKILRPTVPTVPARAPVTAPVAATPSSAPSPAPSSPSPPSASPLFCTPQTPAAGGVVQRATVVGAGPTGLAQAALLLRRAKQIGLKELTIVELRGAYTRPVALSLRQVNFDALKWLNPTACAELQKRANLVPRDDDKGFLDAVHFDAGTNAFVMSNKPAGLKPDGARFAATLDQTNKSVAELAHEMMGAPTIGVVTMQELEEIFWRGLTLLAASSGVTLTIQREHDASLSKDAHGDVAVTLTAKSPPATPVNTTQAKTTPAQTTPAQTTPAQTTLPKQDLVVVAQGGNSQARRELGLDQSTPMSPTDWYISGALQDEVVADGRSKKVAEGVYKEATVTDPKTGLTQTQRLVRTTTPNGNHWLLLQVPEHQQFCSRIDDVAAHDVTRLRAALAHQHGGPQAEASKVPDVEVVKAKKTEEVEQYWRKQHQQTGRVDLPSLFGPFLFPLQARMFAQATLGNNAIAVGDSVGTSHFNVSAGAATGFTMHTLALDRYLQGISSGTSKQAALQQLDVDVRQATMTWQLFGITQFEGDPRDLAHKYFPKSVLEAVLPKAVVEKYWPANNAAGVVDVDKADNPAWHAWLHKDDATTSVTLSSSAVASLLAHRRAQNGDSTVPGVVQSEPRLSA